ncbi:MAG: M56 family metallopeptidase [bacterium]
MTAIYEWLGAASAWWWPRFADHLWQTTVFALVILVASFVLRRGPAQWRHTFCLLASAKFLIPAALFVFLAQQTGIQSFPFLRAFQQTNQNSVLWSGFAEPVVTLASTYEVTIVAGNAARHHEIYFVLTAIWLIGSLTILLLWGIRRHSFLRSLRLSQISRDDREWQALERARSSLHWQGKVGLVISPLKIEPAVWRVWRPTIVLPKSIAKHLDEDELEAIMLHELVHIQRRDNLIGNVQLALCALLWFHPLVWFISRRLFDEREQACDERVMEVCRMPEAYASSILKVVRFCFGWRVAGVTGAASGSNLRRRIENIMSTGNAKRSSGLASRLLAVALVGLALLILVAAGVYSRPRALKTATGESGEVGSLTGSDQMTPESAAAADKRSSKKVKQPPPPPPSPASPSVPSTPAQPPQPPQPAQPVQAAQPAEPPAQDKDSDKSDKDKSSKEKSKEKVKKGELIEAPRPVYPEEAKEQKIEGIVAVVITIGDDGHVIYAKADSGPKELYAVSEAAALKARFKPSLLNGEPVKVKGVMSYKFVLDKP